MIFARCIDESEDKCLTPGKVYLAQSGLAGESAYDAEVVTLVNDCGERVNVRTGDGRFEFLPQVYAVCVRPAGNWDLGDVGLVDDADEDGEFFRVNGAYMKADCFELLDQTNVRPGVCVMLRSTGAWLRITSVNERLECTLDGEGGGIMHPPCDFRFAVGGGGIMAEPRVLCVNANDTGGKLTEGRLYLVGCTLENGTRLLVRDNTGEMGGYLASRFTFDV